jgi:hypothetical protein
MAQYPIDRDDRDNIADAVNTLLSGPSGLGQNFAGFSAYVPAYLTGNFRVPFTQLTIADLYVPPISLSTSEMLDNYTYKFTFASVQPSIPFAIGQGIYVSGVTNSFYNGSYTPIGVVQCTDSFVIARLAFDYGMNAPSTGGTVEFDLIDARTSTDANAKVTVTSATDRVFISGQLDQTVSYTSSGTDDLFVDVQISRYYAELSADPLNPDFRFILDDVIVLKTYTFTGVSGTGTLPLIETVFATTIDSPRPSYYWYILEVTFRNSNGLVHVTDDVLGLRGLSAQVVKQ